MTPQASKTTSGVAGTPHGGATRTTEGTAPRGSVASALSDARRRAALGFVAVALSLLLVATPADAAGPSHPLLFSLQGTIREPGRIPIPPPEGEFEDACGVAVDPAGDIYLSDYYHHTIDVYGPGREYLTQFVDPDPDGPCNLAVDPQGDVYVDNWRRDVVRFVPSQFPPGARTTYGAATVVDHPSLPGARSTGVFLDPGGDLYVDDRTYVAVYKPAQLAQAEPAPARTIGLGLIGQGYGVAVSDFLTTDGDVYVPDATTDTVKVFAPAGALVDELDGAGTPRRGFSSLADSAVAVDQTDGHLFVADNLEPGFERPAGVVDEFNPSGAYRGQLPATIVDAEPTALAVDGAGDVLATSGNSEAAVVLGFGPTAPAHLLTVGRTGIGAVTSEPAGINCGTACAAEYDSGEEVVLLAVAGPGSVLAGWSGCDHASGEHCVVAMDAERAVSAAFEPGPSPTPMETHSAVAAPSGSPSGAARSASAAISLRQEGSAEGSAVVELTLPSDGSISVRGSHVVPISRDASAGAEELCLHLDRGGHRALARSKTGELAVPVHASFRPSGGGAQLGLTHAVVFRATRGRPRRSARPTSGAVR